MNNDLCGRQIAGGVQEQGSDVEAVVFQGRERKYQYLEESRGGKALKRCINEIRELLIVNVS